MREAIFLGLGLNALAITVNGIAGDKLNTGEKKQDFDTREAMSFLHPFRAASKFWGTKPVEIGLRPFFQ